VNSGPRQAPESVPARRAVLLTLAAAAAFHLAYSVPLLSFLIVAFLYCLFELSRAATWRLAFLCGLGAGMLAYAPQLAFFWTIFGPAAIDFWLVLAFWLGVFVALLRAVRLRHGAVAAVVAAPVLWTGLEYFRSELYYLRFSWLDAGYALAMYPQALRFDWFGVYGIGFVGMALVGWFSLQRHPWLRIVAAGLLVASGLFLNGHARLWWARPPGETATRSPYVLGVQLEFAQEEEIISALDDAVRQHPGVDIIVLSEYAFQGPVPETVRAWCREHAKYLIAGGKDPVGGPGADDFYNTAFVIGPDGEVAFKQAKSVPIQFFKDGLPATDRKPWPSPWGNIGLCICYDLSYTRVTDDLIRQGARALIVPTMDVEAWGRRQHELHARIAAVRAAEYRVPVFRVCSSGISQAVEATGKVRITGPYGAYGWTITDLMELRMDRVGHLPLDRWLAPLCVGLTGLGVVWLGVTSLRRRRG
jgi:apolipoprotein N-acyltransferase